MSELQHAPRASSPSMGYAELVPQAPFTLRELIAALGYVVEKRAGTDGQSGLYVATATLQVIAVELAALVGKTPAWGWRYLHGVLNQKEKASLRLTQAIFTWGAIVDGHPAVLANTENIAVRAKPGQLHPGAVVLAGSKRCANPACRVAFVPVVPWQKFCQARCARSSHAAAAN